MADELKTAMVAHDDLANSKRKFYIAIECQHFMYLSQTRDEFEKNVKDQLEAASKDCLESIMKDYDEPKSS